MCSPNLCCRGDVNTAIHFVQVGVSLSRLLLTLQSVGSRSDSQGGLDVLGSPLTLDIPILVNL